MARIRTIKPEFFKHETLFDAEQETGMPLRVAFAGLWTVCDREGRFEWRPRAIKTDVLPYDDIDFSRVLDALATRGFVVRYRVDGKEYGLVPGFSRHQVINNRETESRLPAPVERIDFDEQSTREARVNDASVTRHDLAQAEGKGREGKGKEGGGGSACAPEVIPPSDGPTFRECVLDAMGIGPDGVAGPSKIIGGQGDMAEAARWLAMPGMTPDAICDEIRRIVASKRDGPPGSFRYFTSAMQRLSSQLSAPALQPIASEDLTRDPAIARDRREAAAADRLGRILDAAARTD